MELSGVAKPFIRKKLDTIRELDQLPSFTRPESWVPKPSDENEAMVVWDPRASMNLILATPTAMADQQAILEILSKIRQRAAGKVLIVEPSILYSAKARLEASGSINKVIVKEKSKARDLFVEIINQGIEFGASDVHVCVREETGRVLYRINGTIRQWRQFGTEPLKAAMSIGFTMDAQEKTRSDGAFQEGFSQRCMIPFEANNGEGYNLRYQSEPVIGGFDVVIRYLKSSASAKVLQLDELGYEKSQREMLNFSASKAIGVTLIAGVTGSGKTTTLNTLLMTLPDRSGKKIYAYEDPTEYRIRGVSQVSIPAKAPGDEDSNPFLIPMKNFLRMDPDVGMLGEVRDKDSALILQQAIESGHQMFSTVHATSAFGIIKRLISPQIGLTREVLGADDFLTALVYQRLVARNCPHCSVKGTSILDPQKLAALEVNFEIDVEQLRCASDNGCDQCRIKGFGYKDEAEPGARLGVAGVTVIAEIVLPDDEIRRLITEGKDLDAKRYWRGSRRTGFTDSDMRGKTAFEHGIYKASQGLVDIRFVEDAFMGVEFYQPQAVEGLK